MPIQHTILAVPILHSKLTMPIQHTILTMPIQHAILTVPILHAILAVPIQHTILTTPVQHTIPAIAIQNKMLTVPMHHTTLTFTTIIYNTYHAIFQTPPGHPGLLGSALPWRDALSFRVTMTLSHNCGVFIGLARDRSCASNRITLDPATQQPRIHYRVTAADALVVLQGRSAVMRCMAGASPAAVLPIHTGAPWYCFDNATAAATSTVVDGNSGDASSKSAKQSSDSDRKFEQYLSGIAALGVAPNTAGVFSAHQMGSCRYLTVYTAITMPTLILYHVCAHSIRSTQGASKYSWLY
jgi:hypothetical protein